jgi:hypothetical protein
LEHIKFGKDIALDWCPIIDDFADADSISTTGWQSAQCVTFLHLSLVYFGLVEDFDDIIDKTNVKTFQQVFVVWFLLILSLFSECVCNPELVDDYGRLFHHLVFAMGCQQKKLPKTLQPKKGRGDLKQLSSKTLKLYPQLRQAPKELPESSQRAPAESYHLQALVRYVS